MLNMRIELAALKPDTSAYLMAVRHSTGSGGVCNFYRREAFIFALFCMDILMNKLKQFARQLSYFPIVSPRAELKGEERSATLWQEHPLCEFPTKRNIIAVMSEHINCEC
jgi:hypothetical protein